MRFELLNEDTIIDMDTMKEYKTKQDLCDLLNEQEMEKMEYKRKMNTFKYRIQKVMENVWNTNSQFRWTF